MKIDFEHIDLKEGKLRYEHLLGREFIFGVQDCYTLLMDMFYDNLGIQLTNYARPTDWWLNGMNIYMENYAKEGFQKIDILEKDLRPLDVILISIPDGRDPSNTVANHCAVYLGQGMLIHHRLGKRSEITPYRYSLKDYTACYIRHKDTPDFTQSTVKSQADLINYILPHNRQKVLGAQNDR